MYSTNDDDLKKQIILRGLLGNDNPSYSKPMIGDEQTAGVARQLSNAGHELFGGKPQFPVGGGTKLAEAMALANYKQQIKPQSEGYFTVDESGNPTPVEGMGNRKPAPIGYSGQGQRALSNRADASASMVPLREAQTQSAETGNKIMNQYLGGDPSNPSAQGNGPTLPPGTTMKAGPMSIPMNPALTEGEASRVSALPTMNRLTEEIKGIVQSPEYSKGSSLSHAFRGMAVDQTKMPFLTMGNNFSSNLQSKLANLKTTFFAEGGKNLTENEIGILSPLLEISGKSPERIVQDYNTFIIKYNEFLKAKKGGLMGYNPQSSQQSTGTNSYNSPEEADAHEKPGAIVMVQGKRYQV